MKIKEQQKTKKMKIKEQVVVDASVQPLECDRNANQETMNSMCYPLLAEWVESQKRSDGSPDDAELELEALKAAVLYQNVVTKAMERGKDKLQADLQNGNYELELKQFEYELQKMESRAAKTRNFYLKLAKKRSSDDELFCALEKWCKAKVRVESTRMQFQEKQQRVRNLKSLCLFQNDDEQTLEDFTQSLEDISAFLEEGRATKSPTMQKSTAEIASVKPKNNSE